MEQTATGSNKDPFFPYKLQELLTSDRPIRRNDSSTKDASAATTIGNSHSSLASPNDQEGEGKTMTKCSSPASNGTATVDHNQGLPASFKVAPIVLKKCNPAETRESENILISVSEDTRQQSPSEDGAVPGTNESGIGRSPPPVKIKEDDLEYMGAQIDKLLNMPSPKSSWKAPRRQRKYQCDSCNKSYSTEQDLRSHEASHSKEEKLKPFKCDYCDKRFRWIASMRVHKAKAHGDHPQNVNVTADNERSQEEGSPKEESEAPEEGDQKISPKKSVPINPQVEHQTFDSVIEKMLTSGLVSTKPTTEKSPRRQRSNSDVKEVPSTRSASRKNKSSPETPRRKAKKVASSNSLTEEAEDSSSPQTSGNRSSLRRNIQRPKWLADADLVTDYEFPRGTNAMRTGNATPPVTPSASTPNNVPMVNGNSSQSRKTSTDSVDDGTNVKSLKSEKPKLDSQQQSASVRERKRKEDTSKGNDPASSKQRKRDGVSKKAKTLSPDVEKKAKRERRGKYLRASNKLKSQSVDVIEGNEPSTKSANASVLSISLDDNRMDGASADKISPVKLAQKRTGSESPSVSSKVPGNRRSKRIKSIEAMDKNNQTSVTVSDSPSPLNQKHEATTDEPNKNGTVHLESTMVGELTSGNIPSTDQGTTGPVDVEEKYEKEKVNESISLDARAILPTAFSTVEKTIEDAADSNALSQQIFEQPQEKVGSPANNTEEHTNTEGLPSISNPNSSVEMKNSDVLAKENVSLPKRKSDEQPKDSNVNNPLISDDFEIKTQDTGESFFGRTAGITFADVANGFQVNSDDKQLSSNFILEDRDGTTGVVTSCLEPVTMPLIGSNDEEMPILRPETSSSAAGSRSDSFAERFASVDADEDFSGSSNHSTVPQAPVLSKEAVAAAASFSNSFLQIPDTSKSESAGSTVPDQHDEVGIILDEEGGDMGENSRLRRDRSDSLSMRSCGSGSQSEKIKALEDSTSKDKRIQPEQDCLVDSDSNDSLMSEFSELAAQLSEKTDGVKFKEECLRFITTKVSANSMWLIRKELKRLKKDKNYFKFGKLSPLAAGLMHDLFCQSLK